MASSLNISLSTYGKIERGECEVNNKRIALLAEILGVSHDCIVNVCDEILQLNNEIKLNKLSPIEIAKSSEEDKNYPLISTLVNQVDKLIRQNDKLVSIIENKI